ncbi:effector-associated constant component EACC1 [Streptomyces barkulensis]|uniref:effector-associated constant component EACC1 n=1 Tax=Streptomyces barkulensis TaxID=1257026 RepID=UPI00187F1F8B|nr:hypothetical protein [Streptomyces barkulensis]
MQIRFEMTGPNGDEDLRSLYHWLSDDRALRGHVRVRPVVGDSSGRMGAGLEAVLAVISTAVALAQLPLSYSAWRQGRRPRTPVTINVLGADTEQAEAVLRSLGQSPPAPRQQTATGAPDRPDAADGAPEEAR